MTGEEITEIIEKYRKLAQTTERFNGERAHNYERFADYLEDNNHFVDDDYYETEEDLLEEFKEVESDMGAQWDNWFPEGDDDDSISDLLTKE